MRIAAVIPCYNHARYVGLALDSILAQTRRPDRVIVIDDGSQDDSVAVIESYRDRGVECLAQENRGAHNTINRLVEMAAVDCDAVSILNSDDYYEPGRFAACAAFLEKEPEKSVVCTALNIIDDDGGRIDPAEPRAKWFRAIWSVPEGIEPEEWMGLANFPATTSNVFARAGYLRGNPFRPYRFNHDYFFLSGAAIRGQIGVLPGEPLVNYRVHARNTINTNPAPLIREMLRMHLDLYRDLASRTRRRSRPARPLSAHLRAAWDNVSSFHAGLFQVLLAKALGRWSEDELGDLAAALSEEAFPELEKFPNREIVNAWDESGPLREASGLAEKCDALRRERDALKQEVRDLRELAKLRQRLLESKSYAMGRLLGKRGAPDAGKSAAEKLAALRTFAGGAE
ncbi:MAG: glycosyltransferase family 2 protein [Verrucomicrobiales bacterium]